MPVSGVVIRCTPERSNELASSLRQSGSVEISRVLDDGTLIVVIDTATVDEEVSAVKGLMDMDGVLDVMVAYHNFEDLIDRE